MPRSGRLRTYLKEYSESPRFEKLSFIIPFLVLIVEIILLGHAISINEGYVIILTLTLLILSIIEINLVAREIHEHYLTTNFDRILTIKLDDFITENKNKNVQFLVEEFIKQYQEYKSHRNEIYHIACQILETHKEELWEKELYKNLIKFLKDKKKMNVDDILKEFLEKNPKYTKRPGKVYSMICVYLGLKEKKKFNK
jgi:hypothetical protein